MLTSMIVCRLIGTNVPTKASLMSWYFHEYKYREKKSAINHFDTVDRIPKISAAAFPLGLADFRS
jgi:hypothetical protein